MKLRQGSVVFLVFLCSIVDRDMAAQGRLTIDQYLAPAHPYELISAKRTDRIAWLAFERGVRNVYTAASPAFTPVALTRNVADDGIDLTDLRISEDGSVIVFVRGNAPYRGVVAVPASNPHAANRVIWAVRTAGGPTWKVAEGAAPVLSPDGRTVAYVKDGQIDLAAVSRVAPETSNVRVDTRITALGKNGDPRWSPEGSKIAFVSARDDHTLIGIYDVAKRAVSWVSPSADHDVSPTWSPDGTRLAFIRRPGTPFGLQTRIGRANSQSAIPGLTHATFTGGYTLSFWVADIPGALTRDDGSTKRPAREIWHDRSNDDTFVQVDRIQWTRDRLIFQESEDNPYYSVPVTGVASAPTVLTPSDGLLGYTAVSSDGAYLYYDTNVGDVDRRHLWKVPTAGGTAVPITTGDEIEQWPAALSSGTRVAVLSTAAARPPSVAVIPANPSVALGASSTANVIFPKLTTAFPAADHVIPQNVTLTADDGVKFNNQLFLPKGLTPGERRPAVIFVHGGPDRQMLLGYHLHPFYRMAYGVNQWFTSQGYVVLSVNYRGGGGYGLPFRTAPNMGPRGNAEYRDVLTAGKYLQTRPDVDRDKIGIWGLSYGGTLTAQALARNSDIFKVGVDLAGDHLWGNSIDPDSLSFQSSAVGAIDSWKSPILLHVYDDLNTAFAQTTGLVQLLRAHNIYYELIVFPDDVHDSLVYKRWIYTFDRMSEFLRRFIGVERGSTTTAKQ